MARFVIRSRIFAEVIKIEKGLKRLRLIVGARNIRRKLPILASPPPILKNHLPPTCFLRLRVGFDHGYIKGVVRSQDKLLSIEAV